MHYCAACLSNLHHVRHVELNLHFSCEGFVKADDDLVNLLIRVFLVPQKMPVDEEY
jgi:hypothetical protein